MRIAVLVALLMLAACSQREPSATEACQFDAKPFLEGWPCVRARVAQGTNYADIRGTYIATGDYAADEVRAGRMTEAQAKMTMARARQAFIEAAAARDSDPVADYLVLRRLLPR